jgi:hypothetical protein
MELPVRGVDRTKKRVLTGTVGQSPAGENNRWYREESEAAP